MGNGDSLPVNMRFRHPLYPISLPVVGIARQVGLYPGIRPKILFPALEKKYLHTHMESHH